MRLLLTSVLLSLPLASFASLEGGEPGAEPTTTLFSTSTQTLTKTLAGNTVTSTLPSGEPTPLPEGSPLMTSSSSAEAITSQSSPEESIPAPSSVGPVETLTPYIIVSTSISTSATGAPYPIPDSSGGNIGTGTAVPTGTGAPISRPPGIEPFLGAASKLGGQNTLMTLAAVLVAGLGLF
ncbi:MAG: hypothetical protein L6R38_004945 [Xanthoria sp. 2 TBL-2021]|nr:MAG: hypothetical protein L6R38_004945 [Xanthoria sp. 2 TBL-2021]